MSAEIAGLILLSALYLCFIKVSANWPPNQRSSDLVSKQAAGVFMDLIAIKGLWERGHLSLILLRLQNGDPTASS